MASYVFYPLLKAIYDSDMDTTVQILYSEAEKYFPAIEDWEKFKDSYVKLKTCSNVRSCLTNNTSNHQASITSTNHLFSLG